MYVYSHFNCWLLTQTLVTLFHQHVEMTCFKSKIFTVSHKKWYHQQQCCLYILFNRAYFCELLFSQQIFRCRINFPLKATKMILHLKRFLSVHVSPNKVQTKPGQSLICLHLLSVPPNLLKYILHT